MYRIIEQRRVAQDGRIIGSPKFCVQKKRKILFLKYWSTVTVFSLVCSCEIEAEFNSYEEAKDFLDSLTAKDEIIILEEL